MAGDPDKWTPKTRESADHSMPYTVAVAFLHGDVREEHFGDHYLRNPQILALAQRVKVKATEEADRRMPEAMLCRMEVVTSGGERHEAVVEYHKGHWKNPMTETEIEAKFRTLAAEVLKPEQTDQLLKTLWKLEELDDAGDIVRLTNAGAKR
jgi:2-methylcitrate dehydratase